MIDGEKVDGLSVVIACGGTGGHLFPGIAVAEELEKRGHRVVVLISEKKIDELATRGHEGLRFERMPSVAMPRPWSPRMISFVGRLGLAVKSSWSLQREVSADVVLGMGGFTSAPPLMAARWAGRRTMIHESNAVPGRANRFCARFADVILLGMAACSAHFPGKETQVVGTPVRRSLEQEVSRDGARRSFGVREDRATVLVIGGSQGALGINEAIMRSLDRLAAAEIQVIHLAGPSGLEAVEAAYREHRVTAHVAAFCHDMAMAYAAADLVVARAGASTLTELSYLGLPSVLVPFPYAADDHQTRNGEVAARAGAAELVPEGELEGARLGEMVVGLMGDKERLGRMAEASASLSTRDAAGLICEEIERRGSK
jgi:UDP-N-acetylglucosamine--N-acetylmuramyl-(pentapeptide) pyrophosphoryl-undecaprenol N-acetylglucosamine transferase